MDDSKKGSLDRGPVGQGDYVVKDGQCMESIALEHGFFWESLWDHPANAELKRIREDPQCLLPGDRVTIPARETKELPISNEKRHQFRKKGVPSILQIYVKQFGEPRANQPYRAVIDGTVREGVTDSEGLVREPIPPDAKHCKLTVGEDEDKLILELDLGGMDPITETKGIQKRLDNLGFKCAITSKLDDQTRNALKSFQNEHGLSPTGEPDEETKKALKDLYRE